MNPDDTICLNCGMVGDHDTGNCPFCPNYEDELLRQHMTKATTNEIKIETVGGTCNEKDGTDLQGEGEGKD